MARFEAERSVSDFLYAALQLRFGIEARVQDYLDAAMDRTDPPGKKRYSATDLLAELVKENPNAEHQVLLRMVSEQTGREGSLAFTPVRRTLAQRYGKLGGVLHFRLFKDNPVWYLDAPYQGSEGKTLVALFDLLKETADELEEACRGSLLTPGIRWRPIPDEAGDEER